MMSGVHRSLEISTKTQLYTAFNDVGCSPISETSRKTPLYPSFNDVGCLPISEIPTKTQLYLSFNDVGCRGVPISETSTKAPLYTSFNTSGVYRSLRPQRRHRSTLLSMTSGVYRSLRPQRRRTQLCTSFNDVGCLPISRDLNEDTALHFFQ